MPIFFVGQGSPMKASKIISSVTAGNKEQKKQPSPAAVWATSALWLTKGDRFIAMDYLQQSSIIVVSSATIWRTAFRSLPRTVVGIG